ncbi:P-loop containing nucleoside triphosphate hydrolase protein [Phlebopus sp. FC_14]|nr:P-loop containing nucleoside triphosphate hydrolase protein [Phlebopus sp. FC_14]
MASHVQRCFEDHQKRYPPGTPTPPLFVGVQGPQGSGKTFLTSRLRSQFAESLSIAVLSIDDLYLPHAELTALAEAHPKNRLLHGRGQPGTHDIELGSATLAKLKRINDPADSCGEVELPVFDKSLFNGEGDRAPQGKFERAPIDVVILEGWCVGFYPVSTEVAEKRWNEPVMGLEDSFDMRTFVTLEDVLAVNERLTAYVQWWDALDAFIQIKGPSSSPYAIIYTWRLQQEHDMKSKNGGRGMTDEQVKTFVDRYIPGYVFFGDGVAEGPWTGKNGLVVTIGSQRELLEVKLL